MENRKIRELYGRWKFNADLMTCQECGYSVIATRMHETAHHAAGCKHEGEKNPWLQLAEMLQALKVGADGTADDLSKCPQCGGAADNGHDRCIPASAYMCSKCCVQEDAERSAATTHNAKSEPTAPLLAQVGSTDGLEG